jgi:hypothetical protein
LDRNKTATLDEAAFVLFKNQCPFVRTHSYPFSWGMLSESITEGVKEETGLQCVDFEFAARDVSLALPSRWHLVDLFTRAYYCHPLRHPIFAPTADGVVFNMSVICFRAKGEHAINALRAWLLDVYIPLIWPDLLREAMKIVTETKASCPSTQSFEELLATPCYLGGGDPESFSFYKELGK